MKLKPGDPIIFPVDTAVSARYKGAYCSAVVNRVVRLIKVKVEFESRERGSAILTENCLDGEAVLGIGNRIMAKPPGVDSFEKAIVTEIMDRSVYTVAYDDGDMSSMRRTQLVLRTESRVRDFESLDLFPLINPDAFGHPVQVKRLKTEVKEEVVDLDSPCLDETIGSQAVPISSDTGFTKKPNKSARKTVEFGPVKRGKRKSKGYKKKCKRSCVTKAQSSVVAVAVKMKTERSGRASPKTFIIVEGKRIRYYYFVPKEQQIKQLNKKFTQKRKAFHPKKIIQVLMPNSDEENDAPEPRRSSSKSRRSKRKSGSSRGTRQKKSKEGNAHAKEVSAEKVVVTKNLAAKKDKANSDKVSRKVQHSKSSNFEMSDLAEAITVKEKLVPGSLTTNQN